MPLPKRPIEPLIERLIEGKVPKQIGAELGICKDAVTWHLRRYMQEKGCKTLIQAVARYARENNSAKKPPEGVD
jgi:DNA-binding NarL/FixJ family response regulator